MITIDILKREVICIMIDKMKSRISLKEFADVADVSRTTVYRLIDQGDINVIKDKNRYQLKYLDALRIKTRQLGLNPLTMEYVANLGYVYHDLSMDVNDKSGFILEGWRHVLRVYMSQPDEALFEVKQYILKSFVTAIKDMLQTEGTFLLFDEDKYQSYGGYERVMSIFNELDDIFHFNDNIYFELQFNIDNNDGFIIESFIDMLDYILNLDELTNGVFDTFVIPIIKDMILILSERFIGLQKNILSHKLRLLNVTKVTMQLYIDMKRGN